MRLATAIPTVLAAVTLVATVAAGADSPTFGVNPQRTRVVQDTTYGATTDYPSVSPSTVLAPSIVRAANPNGQADSFSVPAVYDSITYQYAYDPNSAAPTPRDSATEAFLYALDLRSMQNAWGNSAWAFYAGDQTCGRTGTGAQTTTPNLASVASPTIAPGPGGQEYVAIGTGCYLYYAPLSSVTPSGTGQLLDGSASGSLWGSVPVKGVSEPACTVAEASACYQQIDMAPLITPPLSVTYPADPANPLASAQTVSTPLACVGAWNQGLACTPLAQAPTGTVKPPTTQWTIPQGTAYTNGGYAVLTSSPAWDPQASVDGSQGAIVFGIDDGTANGAIVFLDPATGAYKLLPLPGAAGVSSSPAVYEYSPGAVPPGTVFVPDNYGDLYQVAPPGTASGGSGGLVTAYMTNRDIAQACANSPWDISDIALGKENVYAIERCLSAAYEFAAADLASKGAFSTLNGLTEAFSPAVVRNPNDPSAAFMFVNSNGGGTSGQSGDLYLYNVGQGTSPADWTEALLLNSGAPAFVAPIADAGPLHALLLWTNSGGGGFNYWLPATTPSTLTLSGPTTVQSGQSVTFTITTNGPTLAPCDTSGAWTCTTLLSNGQQIALNTSGGGVNLQGESMTSTTWTVPYSWTVTRPTTFALEATMQTSADYLQPRTGPLVPSNTLDVTVEPPPGIQNQPTPCVPEGTGWNQPVNCNAPPPTPKPGPLTGTLLMAVDTADSYSPTHPAQSPATPTAFYQNQWGLFGQHLWVEVLPPPTVPAPPTLSSPPSSASAGICQIQFPKSSRDFLTIPPGISEATGKLWPQEWDPLSIAPPPAMPTSLPKPMPAPGEALWSTVLVDWSWWPPLPPGTVTGPPTNPWYVKAYFLARVWRWTYQEHTFSTTTAGKTTITHKWAPACTYQGEEGGTTNPQISPGQGGQVFVWGDRVADVPVTTQETLPGAP